VIGDIHARLDDLVRDVAIDYGISEHDARVTIALVLIGRPEDRGRAYSPREPDTT